MTFSIPLGFSRLLLAALLVAAPLAEAAELAQAAAPVQVVGRLDRIIQQGVLRVGTTGDYKPFSYKSGEHFIGLDIELAQELAQSMGAKLQLVPTTWPTLMNDLQADHFDLAISGISVNMERQRKAFFSQPYQRDGKTPITLCSRQQAFQTLEQIDRPQVTAIVNPGGTNEKFARANLKQARIVVHDDNVTIFQQIVDGKADLMMTDAVETRLQEKLHPQLCAVHPDQPFDFSEKAVLLPRDIVLKQYVDQWLHQDMESGRFAKRMQKWLAYPWQAAHN
ncbi:MULTISPECIES: transporter substrate-binding domain-containing protein [Pseudomonas]|uniref:transporter substrate-binding domain-containing protein n=1 Tax=Pseudomonas TaxID=286 RepID=UPI0006B43153|nr:periplasmic component of amino acid ABC-type transporter/signal transduction system [Pseudomonas fuscovaginae]